MGIGLWGRDEGCFEAAAFEDGLGDVGGDDGEGAEVEAGVEILVFVEDEGGEDDAVDGFEVEGEAAGVGAESAEEMDVDGVGEDGAEEGEGEEGEPVAGDGALEIDVGCEGEVEGG